MTDLFDEIIARGAPPIQDLARQARALIYEVYPPVVEVVWARQGIAGALPRHVKINGPGQLGDPALRRLVEAASRHLPRLTPGKEPA